ncbi:protease modulator HflC [Brachymonas chironomi]|uniref:protease modulator HflC n=1 Tax=Brachymonas chironomi TaxID=491919 RepID=UPI00037BD662|nr:protease modulator HflC [Brachymonas chironomi]
MNNKLIALVVGLFIALVAASTLLFVVDQRQFGVVYNMGQINRVISEPGLYVKMPPPFQNVRFVDKRLLTLDSQNNESVLTAEKQRLVIDWYVRWRIADPQAYIRNVGLDEAAGSVQLSRVVRDAFQQEVNKYTVKQILSSKRDELMDNVKEQVVGTVTRGTKAWGIEIVDVRITRADYAEAITESVYRRMQAERERVANELRSTGNAEGEKIRAEADRQRDVTIAEAYRDAQRVKGEGDAQATRIYGESFGKSPQFANFYRGLEAYRKSFDAKGDLIVVDPQNSKFFGTYRQGGAGGND